MTENPRRRKYDNPEMVKVAVRETLLSMGLNVSTPDALIETQRDMSFLRKSRKVFSVIFVSGLVGGLSLLSKKVIAAPTAIKAAAAAFNPWT